MSDHLVIIGGGQAAAQVIQSARQLGWDGRLTLVASESELPYQRPPLSKQYLAGSLPKERLALRPESFYVSRNVDLLLGRTAVTLDAARRRVSLDDGSTLEYTSALLATGSRPRRLDVPGSALDGIHYLRTIGDVDAIARAFAPGRRAVIVGGGYIGLEVAAVAAQSGLEVTVLEAADRVLARVAAPEVAQFYAERHADAGVKIHYNALVSAFGGNKTVNYVDTLCGTRYEADLVIVGIGIVPNVELALAAGLEVADGIRVDACAQTRAPQVAAAGDCTRYIHPFVGAELRLESVQNAIGQARAAAQTLAGAPQPFTEIPWFWSDQYECKLQIAGVALDYDATVVRGEPRNGHFSLFYLRGGIPIAVDCVSSPRDFMAGKKLLAARRTVAPEALRDLDTDLNDLAAPG